MDSVIEKEFSHMTTPLTLGSFLRPNDRINLKAQTVQSGTLKLPMNDTELKSLSTIRYEPKGIEITEIRTTTKNGDNYNVFSFVKSFIIVVKVNPLRDF